MPDVTVVVGAQYGSEGKGAIAAHLTRPFGPNDIAIRVAGPNAGHTAYDDRGEEWKLRAIPVAAVTSRDCRLYIAPGSEIDLDVLWSEVSMLDNAGHHVTERLNIHPSATILQPHHIAREAQDGLVGRIGSTGKGIGAARADRIMRRALTWGQFEAATGKEVRDMRFGVDLDLMGFDSILVEGTQGYGLGLHTHFYPQVTSSDCRAIDFLAMAGISPWHQKVRLTVQLVARVFPIRVAGNSGPMLGERTWDQLGLPEERTTVTNKVRRVGEWDEDLVIHAIADNGGGEFNPDVSLALTMVDQLYPELRDKTELHDRAVTYVDTLEHDLQTYINFVGTGPNTVVEL